MGNMKITSSVAMQQVVELSFVGNTLFEENEMKAYYWFSCCCTIWWSDHISIDNSASCRLSPSPSVFGIQHAATNREPGVGHQPGGVHLRGALPLRWHCSHLSLRPSSQRSCDWMSLGFTEHLVIWRVCTRGIFYLSLNVILLSHKWAN